MDRLGIVSMTEGDATGILVHFDAEVEAEEAEVAHVELLLHLCLELHHLSFLSAGDDQVIDVDADERDSAPAALPVHRRSCVLWWKLIALSVASNFAF
jgi:hypothetical protein